MVFKAFKKGFFNWCTTLELELTLKEIERKIKSHKRCFLSWKSQIHAVGTSKQLIRIIRLLKKFFDYILYGSNWNILFNVIPGHIWCNLIYLCKSSLPLFYFQSPTSLTLPIMFSASQTWWTWKGNQHFWMRVAVTPIIGCTVHHGCD